MTFSFALFIAIPVVLVILLLWALRPLKRRQMSTSEVLEALTEERHYARLPQILQSLREDDTEFLLAGGRRDLFHRLRAERKRIALRYLGYLEQEYMLLLDASRVLAMIAPEVTPLREFQRFKMSMRFVICSRYLRWRLRLGLQPWSAFGILSDMAGDLTLGLEAKTARLGERAGIAAEFPLFLENRRRDLE